ncbi:hypothetical protein HDU76_005139, partial [Blyttiomyces sp. JEL0837]
SAKKVSPVDRQTHTVKEEKDNGRPFRISELPALPTKILTVEGNNKNSNKHTKPVTAPTNLSDSTITLSSTTDIRRSPQTIKPNLSKSSFADIVSGPDTAAATTDDYIDNLSEKTLDQILLQFTPQRPESIYNKHFPPMLDSTPRVDRVSCLSTDNGTGSIRDSVMTLVNEVEASCAVNDFYCNPNSTSRRGSFVKYDHIEGSALCSVGDTLATANDIKQSNNRDDQNVELSNQNGSAPSVMYQPSPTVSKTDCHDNSINTIDETISEDDTSVIETLLSSSLETMDNAWYYAVKSTADVLVATGKRFGYFEGLYPRTSNVNEGTGFSGFLSGR